MLSIIIITKNEEKTLPRLLESIKNQDFKDYELILSDASSTDKTKDIAKKYCCKIIKGGLPAEGRNNGARVAKGDILLFLDSDTKLPLNFLSKNLKEFNEEKLTIAIPFPIPLSKKYSYQIIFKSYRSFAVITQFFIPNGGGFCIFCKKEIFEKIGGFDETLILGEDHDLIRRCSKYGKFRILKNKPILLDIRRLDKEGRFLFLVKYITWGYQQIILGKKARNSRFSYNMQGVNITKLNNKR
jgi:glycosyltransferase involved in cell wall biosynthesis